MAASVYKWLSLSLIMVFVSPANPDWEKLTESPFWGVGGHHPFHVSTTEINHNAKDKMLEITCHIFTNDLEETLEKNYKIKVDLNNPKDKAAVNKIVNDYIQKHLQLKADGKSAKLTYLGYEIENDAVYAYLQVDSIATVKKVEAIDSILYDQYNDQMSIMHCIVGGKRQSTKLEYPKTNAMFEF